MACPICKKRKAKRFCPAKAGNICTLCCGTEREVTIDCWPDCPHLIDSRRHDYERREVDFSKLPFAGTRITREFLISNQKLILALSYTVCSYARDNSMLVDSDAVGAIQALAEAYRTLSSGLYYEKPPEYRIQRGLYEALKVGIEDFKKGEAQTVGVTVRDGDVRDTLIFMTQLGSMRNNGRAKGRAYLDFLRTQFRPEEFAKPASNIVLLP